MNAQPDYSPKQFLDSVEDALDGDSVTSEEILDWGAELDYEKGESDDDRIERIAGLILEDARAHSAIERKARAWLASQGWMFQGAAEHWDLRPITADRITKES